MPPRQTVCTGNCSFQAYFPWPSGPMIQVSLVVNRSSYRHSHDKILPYHSASGSKLGDPYMKQYSVCLTFRVLFETRQKLSTLFLALSYGVRCDLALLGTSYPSSVYDMATATFPCCSPAYLLVSVSQRDTP